MNEKISKGISRKKTNSKLTALRFLDYDNFCKATLAAATNRLWVNIPCKFTLIIRKSDKKHFKDLQFKESMVLIQTN